MIQRRQRILRALLEEHFGYDLSGIKLLEAGCGNGQWLAEFQAFGIRVANLAGIELDRKRADNASSRITGADIRTGNAAELPWDDDSFDIVFQSTVFTSIPDEEVRQKAAAEMMRVCRRDGLILWYDFTYNSPSNPDVRGIGRGEIRALFKPWNCKFHSVTLAPPVARRVTPVSWLFSEILETFCPFLRTHVIARITPPS